MDICIIGTGYVGLVSAACFAEMGNNVKCVDTNQEIIRQLNEGHIHIYEPGLETLVRRNHQEGRLSFTTDLGEGIADALFIFNCVGTPPKDDGTCDLCYVEDVAHQVGQQITAYKIIIIKSTVPVGTARRVKGIIQSEISKRGITVEFDIVSNPEFLKEGDAVNDFLKPDRVIIGTDNPLTIKSFEALYAPFARSREKIIVMGISSAEMTKYAANCMLATKISFINEIANICERVGADVREVRLGIGADRRIGHHFIYPGVGYGGSCFPKDVKALIKTAEASGYFPELVNAVDKVNERQKKIMAQKVMDYFKERGGVQGKSIAIWGLAFKANTDDVRESAAFSIIQELIRLGMTVRAFDPVAMDSAKTVLKDEPAVTIIQDQYQCLVGTEALIVITDWNQFRNPDFKRIKKLLKTPIIFDGRNLYPTSYLSALGFTHIGIGCSG